MNDPHPLISELRQHRIRSGVTLTALAEALGYSRSGLTYVEQGGREPSLARLDAYAAEFGLEIRLVPEGAEIDDSADWDNQGDQLPYNEFAVTEGERLCLGCRQIRPLRDFGVDRSKRSGRRSRCKYCRRDRQVQRERDVAAAASREVAA